MSSELNRLMALPYHISMIPDTDDGGDTAWVAAVDELPGCISQGDTPEEAATMIREAMEAWFTVALDHGDTIPAPRRESSFSGNFVVRLPRGLHETLDAGARAEGCSLNQYVVALLAGATGWAQASGSRPAKSA